MYLFDTQTLIKREFQQFYTSNSVYRSCGAALQHMRGGNKTKVV